MLSDRRPGAGAGHVRAPALAVGERLPVAGLDRLAAQHVPLHPGGRCVVVDGQRAHDRGRLLVAVPQVGLLADEVLVLHLRPGHARLADVVLALQLEAVGAVALLEPAGGAVDADPDRRDAVRPAGLRDHVPQLLALLDRHVQLPAEVAHVGDARGQHPQRVDLDRPAAAEAEALVGDVVAGHRAQDVTRARPPEAERRPGGGQVGDLGGAVLRQAVGEPLAVGGRRGRRR